MPHHNYTRTSRSLSRGRTGRRGILKLTESERRMREFTKNNNNKGNEATGDEQYIHIIKFKPNRASPLPSSSNNHPSTTSSSDPSEQRGAINKARHAIKKRLGKKTQGGKSKSRSYASEKGIEATIKLDRNETILNRSLSKLKTGLESSSHHSTRGRSLERRKSFGGMSIKRSMSLKRPLSLGRSMSIGRRSLSKGRGRSSTSGFLDKVKTFRRDRSVHSVRSTRSNFSVRSYGKRNFFTGGANRILNFFKRKNDDNNENVKEKVVFVKQVYTPETVKTIDDEDAGFFDGILCDMTVCRNLFCAAEEVDGYDQQVAFDEDDPRDFGHVSYNKSILTDDSCLRKEEFTA